MSLFTEVHFKVPKSHKFSRSRENHLTCQFGQIVPALVEEVYPSDIFKIRTEASIKLAPLKAPFMGRIDAYMHYFFIPNRLVYSNWEGFITGGTQGTIQSVKNYTDPSNPSPLEAVAPNFDLGDLFTHGDLVPGRLTDYFCLPSTNASLGFTPASAGGAKPTDLPPINAIPFLCYRKVFSDWYRDELLDTTEFSPVGDGKLDPSTGIGADILTMRYRCWKKDYFTSARNDTQLGPAQSVPVTGNISASGSLQFSFADSGAANRFIGVNSLTQTSDAQRYYGSVRANTSSSQSGFAAQYYDGLSLEDAGILINDLRRSLKLQEWGEKNMRGGNRYIENIFNHFGVRSSDARLQRSQYLGGMKIPVVVGEVLQSVGETGNSQTINNENAVGVRGGVASAAGITQGIKFRSEEHGFILGLLSIMPHTSYFQGIPRYMADRWDRFGYAWPEFSNLGEQDVYNWEIFVSNSNNTGTFGYQSRYADMKSSVGSEIHGEFRTSLSYWHNARIFTSRPSLNNNFVNFGNEASANGMNRIFAVTSNTLASHFYCHLFNHVKIVRKLSKYGTPGI